MSPYKLSPRPARLGAVFLDQPLAGPAQLQTRAVDEQVQGFGTATSIGAGPLRPRHVHRYGPPAEGGVVRHSEIKPKQAEDGADQAFGLAVRQAEHGPERQGHEDGQRRIPGLPAPDRAWFGPHVVIASSVTQTVRFP